MPPELNIGRVCADCGKLKSAGHFTVVRGADGRETLNSYCKPCMSKRSLRSYDLATVKANKALRSGESIDFSRAVCQHVARYVERKIREFEHANEMEAPPHVQAIRSIARSILAQHPPKEKPTPTPVASVCVVCGTDLTGEPGRVYCDNCREQAERAVLAAYHQRIRHTDEFKARKRRNRAKPEAKERRREAERRRRGSAPRPEVCGDCGTPIEQPAGGVRRYCDDCARLRLRAARKRYRQEHPQPRRDEKRRARERRNPALERGELGMLRRRGRRLASGVRADLAYLYRLNGGQWNEIASRLGYSGTGPAYTAVRRRHGRPPKTRDLQALFRQENVR